LRPWSCCHPINAYRVKATAKNVKMLALAGFDVTEGRP
jgi:hypothetical protein